MDTNNQQETVETEAIEIKTLSLVDATLQTAKASFAELVKESSVDKKARELKAQLKKITIADVNDKENYTKVKAISKDASKIRIAIEKRRKELKADIITAGKSVDSLANEYQALINPIETDADAKLEVIDNAVKEQEQRAEREAKERTDNRVSELIANGIVFTGSWYGINQIQVGIQMIQEMSDDDYADLLSKVKIQNDGNIEAKRIADELQEAERLKQEAITAQNKKDREELEAGRLELRGGQLELLGIALTPEYELLIKTANNEEWKIRYEQLKLDKLKEKRNEELRPYIVYIRDYNAMIGLDEEIYQKEFSDVKEAHRLQMEYDQKERAKEFDRQQVEIKEREEKQKRDRELLATNAKKYENIGFRYDFSKHRWFIQVGDYSTNISEETMLNEKEGAFETVKSLIESWRKEKEENEVREAMNKLAEQEKKQKEDEKKRLSLLSETEVFNEWLSQLKTLADEAPNLTDTTLQGRIYNIIKAINQ